jgi:tetratricopeptide (TPR) repeat protein
MRSKIFLLFALLFTEFCLSTNISAYATATDDWQKWISKGSAEKFDGQYKTALASYTKALDIAEHSKLPAKYLPISLCRIADVEVITNKIDLADMHFQKAIEIIKKQKEANILDPQVSFWAAVLSDSYMSNTRPETREKCLKRTCYLKNLIYGESHKEFIECLKKLAYCYIQNNKVEQALPLLAITNTILDKKYGRDPDRLGDTLYQLALKCEKDHKYKQAKELILAIIKIANTNSVYLGAGLPAFYCFLSMNAHTQAKTLESKKYFQLALTACQKIKASQKQKFIYHAESYLHAVNHNEMDLATQELEAKEKLTLMKAMTADPRWQCGILESITDILYGERKYDESALYLMRAIAVAELPNCYEASNIPELYLKLGIHQGQRGKFPDTYKSLANAYRSEKDKVGYHATSVLFWWGYFLRGHKQFDSAFEKLNIALKQANALAPEKRGTLLADILETLAITNYELNKIEQGAHLRQKSAAEIQLQKKLKTNLGPDFFHRI